jgi:hypothetical protein
MRLPYEVITGSEVPYDVFGLDKAKIEGGELPSEQAFTDAVKARFKEVKKPFKNKSREDFYASDAWKEFQRDVRAIYKALGALAVSDVPVKHMDVRLEQLAKEIAVVRGLIEAREALVKDLGAHPDKAIEIVQEALKKKTVPKDGMKLFSTGGVTRVERFGEDALVFRCDGSVVSVFGMEVVTEGEPCLMLPEAVGKRGNSVVAVGDIKRMFWDTPDARMKDEGQPGA